MTVLRTRWAAIGAAVAVSLGAGGIGIGNATTSSGERPIYVPIEPCRLAFTTTGEFQVGPRSAPLGPNETETFDGRGSVGDCELPSGITGLALNVTALNATELTNLRFFPAGTGVPTAANLNPAPGQPPTPNAVNVDLNGAGEFSVFNAFGFVEIVIDVVGFYDDHDHDDRYYRKSESDDRYLPSGEIEMTYAPTGWVGDDILNPPLAVNHTPVQTKVDVDPAGRAVIALSGPASLGVGAQRVEYAPSSVRYCVDAVMTALVDTATVHAIGSGASPDVSDGTDRTAPGCFVVELPDGFAGDTYTLAVDVVEDGSSGFVFLSEVSATWVPVS